MTTRSKFGSRVSAVLIISLGCLLCVADSMNVKEVVQLMKEQLQEIEEVMKSEKAKFESSREITLKIMSENIAKVNLLRSLSHVSRSEVENMEDYTKNNNAFIRSSFDNIAAKLQEHESELEKVKTQVRLLELYEDMFSLQGDTSVYYY